MLFLQASCRGCSLLDEVQTPLPFRLTVQFKSAAHSLSRCEGIVPKTGQKQRGVEHAQALHVQCCNEEIHLQFYQ